VGGWKPCVPWAGGDFLESSIVFLSEFMWLGAMVWLWFECVHPRFMYWKLGP
jgi:hypothetical protein